MTHSNDEPKASKPKAQEWVKLGIREVPYGFGWQTIGDPSTDVIGNCLDRAEENYKTPAPKGENKIHVREVLPVPEDLENKIEDDASSNVFVHQHSLPYLELDALNAVNTWGAYRFSDGARSMLPMLEEKEIKLQETYRANEKLIETQKWCYEQIAEKDHRIEELDDNRFERHFRGSTARLEKEVESLTAQLNEYRVKVEELEKEWAQRNDEYDSKIDLLTAQVTSMTSQLKIAEEAMKTFLHIREMQIALSEIQKLKAKRK